MTVDQIAHAFQSGHLNVRTPLWPPGTTGWQALGNFEQFQSNQYQNQNHPGAHYASQAGAQAGLSQFEEADDDPTRMWTGGPEELPGLDPRAMEAMQAQQSRPSARTGTRQVAPRPPVPSQPSQAAYAPPPPPQPAVSARPAPMPSRPVPMASQPVASYPSPTASVASRTPALVPASVPPFRRSRGNGLMLVAGLVGLVGLGSAVLAARGSWGQSEQAPVDTQVAEAQTEAGRAPAEPVPVAPAAEPAAAAEANAPIQAGEAQLAKYEDAPRSAFVAGETAKPAASANGGEAAGEAKPAGARDDGDEGKAEAGKTDDADAREAAPKAEKAVKSSAKARREEAPTKRVAARAAPRRAAVETPRQKPAPAPRVEKVEKPERAEKAVASEPQPAPPSNAAVNEAAAAALANSANLASSCRPRGGPAGPGKARVIYSNDGEVQSVEILTAKFRDTLTGSCVRMVFRRAKIPAFKGEPPTFIKSFTIPEE
jgi:hypothetical protein